MRDVEWAIGRWSAERVDEYIDHFAHTLEGGGVAFGVDMDTSLAGIAILSSQPVESDHSLLELEFLHVSRPHRGRGIGRLLFETAVKAASRRGARGLYVTATPSRPTVDFYLSRGARLAIRPDPARLAAEPDDVHLILAFSLVPDAT